MSNLNAYNNQLKRDFIVHYMLMAIMVIIIFCAIFYAYIALSFQDNNEIKMPEIDEGAGTTHPLPDFIIDKVKPDELMDLKQ